MGGAAAATSAILGGPLSDRKGSDNAEPVDPESCTVDVNSFREAVGCEMSGVVTTSATAVATKVMWVDISPDDTKSLTSAVFQNAADMLDQLLRAGAKDDTKDLMSSTFSAGTVATRLASKAKPPPPQKKFFAPSEVFEAAGSRADLIVLPRLLAKQVRDVEGETVVKGSTDWSVHLAALGLKGEALEIAIERKERAAKLAASQAVTLTAPVASASVSTASLQKTASRISQSNSNTGGSLRKSLSVTELMNAARPPSGWSNATGTIAIGK